MNRNVKYYEKVINSLIKKSFPILRKKKFYVLGFTLGDYSGGAYWFLPFLRVLFINRKRNFNKEQLIGILAHELCHFEIYQKRGWIKTVFKGILYWFDSKTRLKEERETERLLIEKGYAKEAYKFSKKMHKIKKDFDVAEYYMAPKQIKDYAKKIGKW